jgi:stearoyl-CoA desaturase (delta-9 desaturase)
MSIDTRDESTLHRSRSTTAKHPHHHEGELAATGESALLDIRPVRTRKEIVTSGADGHNPWQLGLDYPVLVWFGMIHLGALAAPFFFTWKAFGLFLFMSWLTGCVGVCTGFHRLLTHGSFCTYRPVRWFFAAVGQLAGEGTVLQWVATHRKHHAYSDQPEDPHTPREGGFWAHINWMTPQYGRKYFDELMQRYCPDLLKDRGMLVLHKLFVPMHVALGALFYTVGYLGWDAYTGASFVVWGMFVRLIYVLHVTWFVNSATHMWGYRNYKTTDDSTNLWWVGLLGFGEGWHNNHHAYQRMARHGHRWWEFDMTYVVIRALEKCGLAWNVVHDVTGRKLHGTVDHA